MSEVVYNTVTISAAVNGWVLTVKGEPPEVFVRWDELIYRLHSKLANR